MNVSHLPLFRGIHSGHLEWALSHFREADLEYGLHLIEEGESDTSLICVVDGELEIRTGETLLGKAGPGGVVGEMAMFGFGMRMASVETLTNTKVLLLDRVGYHALREAQSPVALAIENVALASLMERLTTTSDRIAELAKGTPAANLTPGKTFFQRIASVFGGGGRRTTHSLDIRAILGRAPFFQDAHEAGLDELAAEMSGVEFSPGEVVIAQGSLGREMFVMAEGLVDVVINTGSDLVEPLAALEPGDAFGMVALLDDRPRMASCIARSDTAALVLPKSAWDPLVTANSHGGSALRGALIRCLSDQLAFSNAQLSQLDMTKKREAVSGPPRPLLMASATMDTYGKHTHGDD